MEKAKFLGEENYPAWSARMKALLEQRRLWEAVDPGYGVDGHTVELSDLNERQRNKNSDAKPN